jgi:hypothetical protein
LGEIGENSGVRVVRNTTFVTEKLTGSFYSSENSQAVSARPSGNGRKETN